MHAQQIGAASYWDFYVFIVRRHPGGHATRPLEGAFRRSPFAELGDDTCSFAGNTEGCRVGEAWLGRAAARGWVALGRAGASQGILKPKRYSRS